VDAQHGPTDEGDTSEKKSTPVGMSDLAIARTGYGPRRLFAEGLLRFSRSDRRPKSLAVCLAQLLAES
jgi:hypothetical protein